MIIGTYIQINSSSEFHWKKGMGASNRPIPSLNPSYATDFQEGTTYLLARTGEPKCENPWRILFFIIFANKQNDSNIPDHEQSIQFRLRKAHYSSLILAPSLIIGIFLKRLIRCVKFIFPKHEDAITIQIAKYIRRTTIL